MVFGWSWRAPFAPTARANLEHPKKCEKGPQGPSGSVLQMLPNEPAFVREVYCCVLDGL